MERPCNSEVNVTLFTCYYFKYVSLQLVSNIYEFEY